MRTATVLALLACTLTPPATCGDPWEMRASVQVPVPLELPNLPPGNPFASSAARPPTPQSFEMSRKFDTSFLVPVAYYIGSTGLTHRAIVLSQPIPDIATEIQADALETKFDPAEQLGNAVAVWLNVNLRMIGDFKKGEIRTFRLSAVPVEDPPVPDQTAYPEPAERDIKATAVPLSQLDKMPQAKRFKASISAKELRTKISMVLEVNEAGGCSRLVFLSCPEGLRPWILASAGAWRFDPGRDESGSAVSTWVRGDLDLEYETGSWKMARFQVLDTRLYP